MFFTEWLALAGVFVSVLIIISLLMTAIVRQIKSNKRAEAHVKKGGNAEKILAINEYFTINQAQYNHYFSLTSNAKTDETALRLLRSGFFSVKAKFYLNTIRISLMVIVALGIGFVTAASKQDYDMSMIFVFSMVGAGIVYILVGVVLNQLEKTAMAKSRRLLPDLLDLLVVCLDAGVSLDAAFERVSPEFSVSNALFSFHLVVLTLEVRAGRSLAAAMHNLAQRLRVEEFRTLAVLFKQSERLGASVNDALRIYSEEMRERRLLLAEEKANKLPVKMLLPMAVIIFPVNLMVVLLPIVMNLSETFSSMGN